MRLRDRGTSHRWWNSLSEGEQGDVAISVRHLMEFGPALEFPHSSPVMTSRHPQMCELRTQSGGRLLRTLYMARRFPDCEVRISQFEDVNSAEAAQG